MEQQRVKLVLEPTPLHKLPRLGEFLGAEVYAKRDDLTGLAGGGNKARKLEYIVHHALESGADTLLTVGAVQSNHARMTAAAAAQYDLDCHLILEGRRPQVPVGNLLLDHILGATISFCDEGIAGQVMDRVADEMQRSGRSPYKIPVGGSNVYGVLGYVRGVMELTRQVEELDIGSEFDIVCACGSGGTLAGIVLGVQMYCPCARVYGISVSRARAESEQRVADLYAEAADLLGVEALPDTRIDVSDQFIGEGYGIATTEGIYALKQTARREGLLLDPVYTAKAMAALFERAKDADRPLIFWHTGGSEALGAHPQIADEGEGE